MPRSTIWDEVERLAAAGEQPVIRVSHAMVVLSKRPPGRPRTKPEGSHLHYNWTMKTPVGVAMRCRNFGCDRFLKVKDTSITCGPACAAELQRYCEVTLDVLTGKISAKDYPPDLRARKNSQKQCRRRQ